MKPPKQKLLLFETRMLGDAVLSLPFLRGAMEKFEVTVCCLPQNAAIYRWLLPSEKVIEWEVPWESRKSCGEKFSDLVAITRRVRSLRFDAIVSCWPDARVHIWMALTGIPRRVGFPMNRLNYYGWQRAWRNQHLQMGRVLERLGSIALMRPLLTQLLAKNSSEQRHWMDWKQIAEAFDVPCRTDTPWAPTDLSIVPAPLRQFIETERAQNRKIWMIHPGARAANRRWPMERFQDIADHYFLEHQCSVVAIRPPDSAGLSVQGPHQFDYAAANLDELAAAVASVDGLLANDSMITHLGAALGKRVVAVFGPGSMDWFTPFQNDAYIAYVDICPHHPCIDRCLMPSVICLEQLDAAIVKEKLDAALASL